MKLGYSRTGKPLGNLSKVIIPPIMDSAPRPVWSVMIPSYNAEDTIQQTLEGVFVQDPGPELMQIEVVDDCSTDNTEAVVSRIGRGRVTYHRHRENIGHVRTFNDCLLRSRGFLVHILHGDDYVRDGFYQRLQRAFEHSPEVGAAFVRHIYMDAQGHWQWFSPLEQQESGIIDNWLMRIAADQRIQPPSIAVRRELYERVGGFDERFSLTGEDWEMWVRVAANTKVWYEPEPLAVYRVRRAGSLGERLLFDFRSLQDLCRAVEIVESWLPAYLAPSKVKALLGQARRRFAGLGIDGAEANFRQRNRRNAIQQLREALKCSRSPSVVARVFSLLAKESFRRVQWILWSPVQLVRRLVNNSPANI